MKLFENGVGRPSNEIIRKRKIFIVSAIVLCVALVSVLAFAFTKVRTDKLQGAVTMASVKTDYKTKVSDISCWYANATDKLSCDYYFDVKVANIKKISVSSKITKVGSDKYPGGYKSRSAYGTVNPYNVIDEVLTIAIDDGYSKNKAIEITMNVVVYGTTGGQLYTFDYVHTVNMGNQKVKSNPNGTIKNLRISNNTVTTTHKKSAGSNKNTVPATNASGNNKTLTLTCPTSAKTYEHFLCTTNQAGVKVTVGGAKALSTTASFTTTTSDMTKSIKYTNTLFNGEWNIKKDSNGQEYVNAQVTASKSGYNSVTKYVKIYKGSEPSNNSGGSGNSGASNGSVTSTTKKLTLECPSSKKIDETFKCTTNQTGVKITLGGAKSLASGIKSNFTTTSSDKTKDIKYAAKLFTDYKSIIKKDSNGKEYINAKVTASKSGYNSVTKYVKIYKKPLTLSCAEKVNSGSNAVCHVTSNGKAVGGATLKIANSSTGTIIKHSKNVQTHYVKFNENLFTKYKSQIKKDSNGKEYIKAKVTATINGYVEAKDYIIVYKVPKSTTKSTTKKDDNFSSDEIYYGIYKVMKNEEFGSKNVEFKINRVGKDVKKVQFVVCNDKEQCINYNTNSNNPTTGLKDAKVGNVYKLNIFTPYDELLDQRFFVRMISYDKNGKEIYFKVHEFYTNLATDKSSPNKNVSKEEDVEIGDFAGATHDFIVSEHTLKELKNGKLNYAIPSITKLDNNGKKQLNIFIKEWDSKVKYVTYVVCNSEADCNKSDAIEQVSKNNEIGTVVKDVEVSRGAKIEITLNSKSKNLLKQKVYVRIFTYDSNKNVLFTKMHEFSTLSYTKKGTKKESDIQIGERAATSQKFINHQILTN